MPGEVGGIGAEGGLGREGEGLAVEVGEFEVGAAGEDGFGDVRVGDLDAEVVVDGPKSGVEEVVGVRGQGQTCPETVAKLTLNSRLWFSARKE